MIIAQISDTHITMVGEKIDRIYKTAEHLQNAVAHLMQLPAKPDVVVITGDCVDRGTTAEYQRLKELLRPLTLPVYLIPGNHDNRENFIEAFGSQGISHMTNFVQFVIDDWPVRLIMLDTNIPQLDKGQLCKERLNWLAKRLAQAPEKPTMIFLHHPPFATGLKVLDDMLVDGVEALGDIVARYHNIERIVAGHVHTTIHRRFYGTIATTCPSTAHQVYLDFARAERLATVMETPACLLHTWSKATGLLTHTSYIGEFGTVKEVHDGNKWLS